jgi:hypothetical protein
VPVAVTHCGSPAPPRPVQSARLAPPGPSQQHEQSSRVLDPAGSNHRNSLFGLGRTVRGRAVLALRAAVDAPVPWSCGGQHRHRVWRRGRVAPSFRCAQGLGACTARGWLFELWRVCARSQGCRGTRPRRAGWSSSAGAFWGCGAASGRHDPGWPAPRRSSCASRTGRSSSRCWQAALIAANGYKGGTSVVTGLIAVPAPVASVVVRHDLHHVSVDDSAGVREAL